MILQNIRRAEWLDQRYQLCTAIIILFFYHIIDVFSDIIDVSSSLNTKTVHRFSAQTIFQIIAKSPPEILCGAPGTTFGEKFHLQERITIGVAFWNCHFRKFVQVVWMVLTRPWYLQVQKYTYTPCYPTFHSFRSTIVC